MEITKLPNYKKSVRKTTEEKNNNNNNNNNKKIKK